MLLVDFFNIGFKLDNVVKRLSLWFFGGFGEGGF